MFLDFSRSLGSNPDMVLGNDPILYMVLGSPFVAQMMFYRFLDFPGV